jgi:hypothetical protein
LESVLEVPRRGDCREWGEFVAEVEVVGEFGGSWSGAIV